MAPTRGKSTKNSAEEIEELSQQIVVSRDAKGRYVIVPSSRTGHGPYHLYVNEVTKMVSGCLCEGAVKGNHQNCKHVQAGNLFLSRERYVMSHERSEETYHTVAGSDLWECIATFILKYHQCAGAYVYGDSVVPVGSSAHGSERLAEPLHGDAINVELYINSEVWDDAVPLLDGRIVTPLSGAWDTVVIEREKSAATICQPQGGENAS